MALNHKISTPARSAAVQAVTDLVDAESSFGYIEIRTGNPPTNVSDGDSGTLLATLTLPKPWIDDITDGVATADTIPPAVAVGDGDAGHYRIKDSDDVTIMQGTAGESADTPNMVFDEKSILTGGTVTITAMTITMPIQ